MANEERDRADVDRLVKGLAGGLTAGEAPGGPAGYAPGRPFTTAKLLMPPPPTWRSRMRAQLSRVTLPELPSVPALPSLPAMPALPSWPTKVQAKALVVAGVDRLRRTPWGTLSVHAFVGLGATLGAAMLYWPYAHAWSWGLIGYLATVMLLVVTGIWGAKLSWDQRLPAAHTVAVGTIMWAIGLLAVEAVPRIGYL